ncbi:MAG TPA: ABC transporter substrate-binding protein [Cellulomonas sp.]
MRRTLTATGAVAVLALLAACGGGQVRGDDTATTSSDDTFTYVTNTEIITEWDPAVSYSNEIRAMENIYESLTSYDAETETVEPRLATSWTSSDDGTTWTFTLRDDVTFHSGRALDATAAKEALDRTIELGSGAAYIWDSVESIEATDATTLVLHLSYAAPIDLIASSAYAAYIYDTEASGDEDLGDWFAEGNDAGSGPYTVGEWSSGQEYELTLQAYDDYWGGWTDGQYTTVEYRVTPETTTAWQLLQNDEVDFVEALNPETFEVATSTDGIATTETASFQNLLALYDTADGPMADVRVRQAVQLATDTAGLVESLGGAAVAAEGLVPDGLLGSGAGITWTQDLDAASALLAEAGYDADNPLSLTMTYAQGDDNQQLYVTLLTSALAEIGVSLDAQPLQWNAQWDQAKSGDGQDIFVMYWYPDYADAYSWFENVFRSSDEPYFNLSYLADPEVDTLIDQLPSLTATDSDAAQAAYVELQQLIEVQDAAVTTLWTDTYQRAFRDDVQGFTDNPAYPNVVFAYELTH